MVAALPTTTANPPAKAAQRRSRTAYFLLLPGMGWLAVFFAIPFVTLFVTSLQVPVPGTSGQYMPAFDLANYPEALSYYGEQFIRSFVYAGIATVLALIIAYPLA